MLLKVVLVDVLVVVVSVVAMKWMRKYKLEAYLNII